MNGLSVHIFCIIIQVPALIPLPIIHQVYILQNLLDTRSWHWILMDCNSHS